MDYLINLGSFFWYSLIIPIAIWTMFALPIWWIGKFIKTHPMISYYSKLVLFFSLPVSIVVYNLMGFLGTNLMQLLGFTPTTDVFGQIIYLQEIVVGNQESGSIWLLVTGLVAFGAGLMILFGVYKLIISMVEIQQFRKNGVLTAFDTDIESLSEVQNRLNVRKRISLYRSDVAEVPFTFGFTKPVIVIPNLVYQENQLRSILTHEVIHIRRGDFLLHCFEHVNLAVFGVHPLVRVLAKEIRELREMTCDAIVLTDSMFKASEYANLLFEFARAKQEPKLSAALSMAVKESKVKERINQMRFYSRSAEDLNRIQRKGFGMSIAIFVVMIGFVACTESAFKDGGADNVVSPNLQEESAAERAEALQFEPKMNDDETFIVVEQMPEPIGGMKSIYDKVEYPDIARKAGIEGRVVVQFVVDETGKVVDPHVIRGIGGGCDEAAIAAVAGVEFTPGYQRGVPVRVQFQLPIVFRLQNTSEG
ncbi:MAG TPA: hypothetical protein DCE78_00290 [Bacteroidetes bacterium]|nr:hypothetical protein [Bacteroidota bacterium]